MSSSSACPAAGPSGREEIELKKIGQTIPSSIFTGVVFLLGYHLLFHGRGGGAEEQYGRIDLINNKTENHETSTAWS
jgi:hypothetical protein